MEGFETRFVEATNKLQYLLDELQDSLHETAYTTNKYQIYAECCKHIDWVSKQKGRLTYLADYITNMPFGRNLDVKDG